MTLKEKEQRAIEVLKMFEPEDEPYYLCYSGGKDSDCIRILAQLAGVKHDIVHNLTTVDAPETIYYIRAFDKMIEALDNTGRDNRTWQTGLDVMRWWISDDAVLDGQMLLDDIDLLDL